jgi:limonene 1,2-monooxygenase
MLRSWDLFARYVIPELNGYTANQKASADFVAAHKEELAAGRAAVIRATVQGNRRAQEALATTMRQLGGGAQAGIGPLAAKPKRK